MKVQEGRARNVHTQKCKYRKVERGRLGGEDVAMVACGAYHSCAITASGVCVCVCVCVCVRERERGMCVWVGWWREVALVECGDSHS